MVEVPSEWKVEIAIKDSRQSKGNVMIAISDEKGEVTYMTPQQARIFASELIQTVYQADVKRSLQKVHKQYTTQADDKKNIVPAMSNPSWI